MQIQVNCILAKAENYSPTDNCAVCLTSLGAHAHRLGEPTVHTTAGGSRHPMHRACFLESVMNSGNCPICRTDIPLEAFRAKKMSMAKRLTGLSLVFGGMVTYHFVLTRLTNAPRLVAAAPGILCLCESFRRMYLEHTDLGLKRSLKREIIHDLFMGIVCPIALPALSTSAAKMVTKSSLANSCITAALTLAGSVIFLKIVVGKNTREPGTI